MNYNSKFRNIFAIGLLSFLACCHKDIQSEREVYSNNFESGDLSGIEKGLVSVYNGTKVMGFFNNAGFTLALGNLDRHELVKVSFDLYLHDTWSGNNTGVGDIIDGPDIWQLLVDNELFMNTTFSNSGCFPTYCQQQSYPKNFSFHYDAGTAASRLDLPGRCHLQNVAGGTSMYKIVKYINHSGSNLKLEFRDLLKQSNSPNPSCDESWSMDNLAVSIVTLD